MAEKWEYALMAGAAYISSRPDKNTFPAPDGWIEIEDSHKTNPESGFEAVSFSRTNTDGTKEIVISFAGTDSRDFFNDCITDFGLAGGNFSQQLLDAAKYYLDIKKDNPNATITFTGHSLGGGLAALMAGQTVEKRSYTSFPLSFGVAAYAKSTPHIS